MPRRSNRPDCEAVLAMPAQAGRRRAQTTARQQAACSLRMLHALRWASRHLRIFSRRWCQGIVVNTTVASVQTPRSLQRRGGRGTATSTNDGLLLGEAGCGWKRGEKPKTSSSDPETGPSPETSPGTSAPRCIQGCRHGQGQALPRQGPQCQGEQGAEGARA
jgi:hypothetical protein